MAYAVGALAGAVVAALTYFAGELTKAQIATTDIRYLARISVDFAQFAFFVCLVVEVIVATPLLIFARVRNSRAPSFVVAAVLGFALSGALATAFSIFPVPDGTSELMGYFVGREMTLKGWWRLVRNVVEFGTIGAATSIAFCAVAMRRWPAGRPNGVDRAFDR